MTHEQLDIPKDTDLLIHSGDWSNYRDVVKMKSSVNNS